MLPIPPLIFAAQICASIISPEENGFARIVSAMLNLQGIAVRSGHLCAQPLLRHFGLTAALRLSVTPYNTTEEIKQFCTALHKVAASLCV